MDERCLSEMKGMCFVAMTLQWAEAQCEPHMVSDWGLQDQKYLHAFIGDTMGSCYTQCVRPQRTSGVVSMMEGRGVK